MQITPIPMMTVIQPTFYPMSLPHLMSLALTADFKKYTLAFVLNELASTQKDQKKSQNTQTNITSLGLDEILMGKSDQRYLEEPQKNGKAEESFLKESSKHQKVEKYLPKKRQSYQRARCQITQALESSQQIKVGQEKQNSAEKVDEINEKDKIESEIQSIKVVAVKKFKKIKKSKKTFIANQKGEQEGIFQISTTVSLIDTIDHPKITIDRFQIQKKRQNLLSRSVIYDEFEQRKFSYQIRERRELKKLN